MKRLFCILLATVFFCALSGAGCAEAPAEAKIRPLPVDPAALDFENGSFCMMPEDTDKIASEKWFTAALYLEDLYDEQEILAIAPGDTVLINGHVFTVAKVVEHGEEGDEKSELEIYTTEPFEEQTYSTIAFWRWYGTGETSGKYVAIVDDWKPVTRVGSVRVELPLPETFVYRDISGADDPVSYTAEEFIASLGDSWAMSFVTPYNTNCSLRNGRLEEVIHADYPYGPEKEE